jgi:hypothetical protein
LKLFLLSLLLPTFALAQEMVLPGSKRSQYTPPAKVIYEDEVKCISAFQIPNINNLQNTYAAGASGDETFALVDSRDGKKGVYLLSKEGAKFYAWPNDPAYSSQAEKLYSFRFPDEDCVEHVEKLRKSYNGDGKAKYCGFYSSDNDSRLPSTGWWMNKPPAGQAPKVMRGQDVTDAKTLERITSLATAKLLGVPQQILNGTNFGPSFPEKQKAEIYKSISQDLDQLFCGCHHFMAKNKLIRALRNDPTILKYLPAKKPLSCELIARN